MQTIVMRGYHASGFPAFEACTHCALAINIGSLLQTCSRQSQPRLKYLFRRISLPRSFSVQSSGLEDSRTLWQYPRMVTQLRGNESTGCTDPSSSSTGIVAGCTHSCRKTWKRRTQTSPDAGCEPSFQTARLPTNCRTTLVLPFCYLSLVLTPTHNCASFCLLVSSLFPAQTLHRLRKSLQHNQLDLSHLARTSSVNSTLTTFNCYSHRNHASGSR
jgi:hypothetical protein